MNAANIYGRGIAFPPRIGGNGRLEWSEGEENVRESIRIILLTALNERLRRPSFGGGLGEFLFEPNTVMTRHALAERIKGVLTAWEPRISIQAVTVDPDGRDASAAVATIQYKLVATQAQERLSLTITMAS